MRIGCLSRESLPAVQTPPADRERGGVAPVFGGPEAGGRILSAFLALRAERRRLRRRLVEAGSDPSGTGFPGASGAAGSGLGGRLACIEGSLAEAEECLLEALERSASAERGREPSPPGALDAVRAVP